MGKVISQKTARYMMIAGGISYLVCTIGSLGLVYSVAGQMGDDTSRVDMILSFAQVLAKLAYVAIGVTIFGALMMALQKRLRK